MIMSRQNTHLSQVIAHTELASLIPDVLSLVDVETAATAAAAAATSPGKDGKEGREKRDERDR